MPLLWLSLSFLVGILAAVAIPLPAYLWLSLGGLALALWLVLHLLVQFHPPSLPLPSRFTHHISRLHLPVPLPLLLASLALGAARYQLALPDLSDPGLVARFNDQETIFQVEGMLIEPPDVRDTYTNLLIQVESIRPVGQGTPQPAHGWLLARVFPLGDWRYGDRLRLLGALVTPPETEGFSYRDYLYHRQIFTLMEWPRLEILQRGQGNPWLAALYDFRGRALSLVYRLYPDPEASLLAGILLGVETGIPREVTRAFQDTGTAHIIAISGFNIPLTQTALLQSHL